jgi:hypothetical protein
MSQWQISTNGLLVCLYLKATARHRSDGWALEFNSCSKISAYTEQANSTAKSLYNWHKKTINTDI